MKTIVRIVALSLVLVTGGAVQVVANGPGLPPPCPNPICPLR